MGSVRTGRVYQMQCTDVTVFLLPAQSVQIAAAFRGGALNMCLRCGIVNADESDSAGHQLRQADS
jgi:hypothetical protein